MNPLRETAIRAYHQLVRRRDAYYQIAPETPDAPLQRLRRGRFLLVIHGDYGRRVLHQLIAYPFAELIVTAVSSQDAQYLQHINGNVPHAVDNLVLLPQAMKQDGLSLAVSRGELVVVASGRPLPDLHRALNRACVHADIPWIPATLFGAKFTMGPLVLPGETACYTCYERRLRANNASLDAQTAIDNYFSQDASTDFDGQLPVMNQMLSAYLVSEVLNIITARQTPHTLSQEFIAMPLMAGSTPRHNFVPPLEWCPTCHTTRQARHPFTGRSLADVVAQFAAASPANPTHPTHEELRHAIRK